MVTMTELVTRNTDRPKRDKVRMVADDIVTANFVTRGRVHKGQTNGLGWVDLGSLHSSESLRYGYLKEFGFDLLGFPRRRTRRVIANPNYLYFGLSDLVMRVIGIAATSLAGPGARARSCLPDCPPAQRRGRALLFHGSTAKK